MFLESGLQQAGSAVLTIWHEAAKNRERAALVPYLISLVQRLYQRAWVGDAELAAALLAGLRGDEQVGRPVPVDLDELVSAAAHEAGGEFAGCYLNQETGDVVPTVSTDEGMVGEDAIDGKGAFSRFRRVTDELGLREGWLTFRTDREWGRARVTLSEHGITVIG